MYSRNQTAMGVPAGAAAPRGPQPEVRRHAAREIDVQGAGTVLSAKLYAAAAGAEPAADLLVFFHGGGFIADQLDKADGLLSALVAAHPGLLILAPRYTLATSTPFPAAAEDAHAVLQWAQAASSTLGWSGERLLVGGIEAGANLATVSNLIAHDRHGPAIAGQILITPMLDPSLSTKSMRACESERCARAYRTYLPHATDRMHPYASPLQTSRLRHLAPALILSAESDPFRDEAEQYGDRLMANGVDTRVFRLPSSPVTDAPDAAHAASFAAALREIHDFLTMQSHF